MDSIRTLISAILMILCITAYSGCSDETRLPVSVINGVADLRDGVVKNSIVKLNGEWEFYPGRFINPDEFDSKQFPGMVMLRVPGDWNGIQADRGFGTYRIKVLLPDRNTNYSIKLLWVKSAARVWIDNDFLFEQGVIRDPVEHSTPGDYITISDFRPEKENFYITIQVANYQDRRGGLCFPVSIAPPVVMYNNEMRATFISTFIIGALAIVMLFHFALHYYFRRLSLNLYISFACFMVILRLFVLSDSIYIYSLVSPLGYDLLVRFEFTGLLFIFISLMQFFIKLYSDDVSTPVKRILLWGGVSSVVYSALMPVYYIKFALPVFQVYVLAVTFFLILSPLREGVAKKLSGARIYFAIVFAGLLSFINDIIYFLSSRGLPNISGYFFFIFLAGHFVVVSMYFSDIFKSNLSLVEEISLKKKIVSRLSFLSSTDPLTGLFNRRFFDNYLDGKIKDYRKGESLWFVIFDLDYFKKVNDDFGHNAGDAVLKEVSRLSRGLMRTGDVLCRWGGEEFAIVISGMDRKGIAQFTERIRESLENHRFPVRRKITASFGVAFYSGNEAASELAHRADKALYAAKKSGRNRVVFYGDPGI